MSTGSTEQFQQLDADFAQFANACSRLQSAVWHQQKPNRITPTKQLKPFSLPADSPPPPCTYGNVVGQRQRCMFSAGDHPCNVTTKDDRNMCGCSTHNIHLCIDHFVGFHLPEWNKHQFDKIVGMRGSNESDDASTPSKKAHTRGASVSPNAVKQEQFGLRSSSPTTLAYLTGHHSDLQSGSEASPGHRSGRRSGSGASPVAIGDLDQESGSASD